MVSNIPNIAQFNRPKSLNSFGGDLIQNTISALRLLNEHPETIFTVITGEGRFFSAGADVKGITHDDVCYSQRVVLMGRSIR